ncbi:NADH-quinone oxidoreductase subunit NuoH [Georgenia sunbinii]|uniref:NADH-quinone oxidoreductase subunit NuoH n=1 Tax=Georgenia sunbinii TaxID=3117728 RepID=UPI002F260E9A
MLSVPMLTGTPAGPSADFSNDTWWIWVIKAVAIVVMLLVFVLIAIWAERKILARMQTRPGPNVHGPMGLLQSTADAIKLLLKEDINLKGADRFVYLLAPFIAALCAFLIYAVIPFGPEVTIFGVETPLQLADTSVAVLYILGITALGVYGIVLGGWSSNSTFPLLGAVRSSAQVISYELAMGIALVTVFLVSGSASTSQIVDSQERMWWAIVLAPAFLVYLVSMVGEVNRLPFDLPEAEGELVAGHMVEYSSMKFAWFFLAEYVNMLNVSAVAATLFLGGWRAPWGIELINDGMFNEGWWPLLWMVAKIWLVMLFMFWLRATLLRFRYDQFMNLGWKILIPVALGWLVAVAVVQGLLQFTDVDLRSLLFVLAGVFVVVLLATLFLPEKKQPAEEEDDATAAPRGEGGELVIEPEHFDALAGGFPVPPLPGQQLPPSPRKRLRETQAATGTQTISAPSQEATDD